MELEQTRKHLLSEEEKSKQAQEEKKKRQMFDDLFTKHLAHIKEEKRREQAMISELNDQRLKRKQEHEKLMATIRQKRGTDEAAGDSNHSTPKSFNRIQSQDKKIRRPRPDLSIRLPERGRNKSDLPSHQPVAEMDHDEIPLQSNPTPSALTLDKNIKPRAPRRSSFDGVTPSFLLSLDLGLTARTSKTGQLFYTSPSQPTGTHRASGRGSLLGVATRGRGSTMPEKKKIRSKSARRTGRSCTVTKKQVRRQAAKKHPGFYEALVADFYNLNDEDTELIQYM